MASLLWGGLPVGTGQSCKSPIFYFKNGMGWTGTKEERRSGGERIISQALTNQVWEEVKGTTIRHSSAKAWKFPGQRGCPEPTPALLSLGWGEKGRERAGNGCQSLSSQSSRVSQGQPNNFVLIGRELLLLRYPSGAQSVVLNGWSPRTKAALLTFQSKQEIFCWLKTKTFPAWLKELTPGGSDCSRERPLRWFIFFFKKQNNSPPPKLTASIPSRLPLCISHLM